jgi:hypothetical protein
MPSPSGDDEGDAIAFVFENSSEYLDTVSDPVAGLDLVLSVPTLCRLCNVPAGLAVETRACSTVCVLSKLLLQCAPSTFPSRRTFVINALLLRSCA